MVDAVVSFAIEKLGDYVIQQVSIRIGVRDGVDWLRDELTFLLNSAKEVEPIITMEVVRLWINNVNDAANDALPILDEFTKIQQEQNSQDCMQICIGKCKKEPTLYNIGTQIESLKKKISCVKERRTEHGIDVLLAEVRKKDREKEIEKERERKLQRATSVRNKEDVVGFKDDIQTLMAELDGPDLSLRMISIHGMGGLGKTTLAYELYNSSELSKFESRAWVCVTQDYEIKDLLTKIIKSFTRHQPKHKLDMWDDKDVVDLLHHLKALLNNDRYLVVIDDVWNIKAWELLKEAFPNNHNGSRIIITTRHKTIAQNVDKNCFVHQLNFLGQVDSWLLFCSREKSSSNRDKLGKPKAKRSAHLDNLGKEMVDKCQGLPLAIVELTKLLMRNQNYQEWVKIKEDIWRELKDNSAEIKEILSLSYKELSGPAQNCFLYLSRFPPDQSVVVDKLIWLWVAEEFIPDEGNGVVMEDVAEKYLKELINHNLIQIETLQMSGQVAQCRVHEFVRFLAIQQATEDNLLGIFDSSKLDPRPLRQTRQAIYNGIGEFLKLLSFNDSRLRSLAVINEICLVGLSEIKLMYTRFKHLKVLDLISVESERIPNEIGDLVYLKFLGLMGGSEKALVIPPTIGKLRELQTLCGSFSCQYECPKEISELKELRHLYLENFSKRRVRGGSLKIGSDQTKLQTLGITWFEDWIHINTVNLISLRKLCIRDASAQENVSYDLESIAELKSLRTFSLEFRTNVIPTIKPLSSCTYLNRVSLFGKMKDTSDLSLLPNSVTEISLSNSEFKQDPMLTLGKLPNLTALHLDKAYTGNKMVCGVNSFLSLKFLRLKALTDLEELQVEDGALTSLQGFDAVGCDKLNLIPRLGVSPIPHMYRFSDFV